jgi:hypothetical protein
MATTTPNFGWPVPTSTDLVKDGATAIEALGDGIDTSMIDLKGGTTGQILAKATNTDMDFVWVTTDDANAIQNSIVDAKGDIVAASANDTPARLAVGNNGETLIADSSAATGLKWAKSPNFVGCSAFNTTAQSIATSTDTIITFSNESFDTDSFHDNVTNNSRFTIPAGLGGKYLFIFTQRFGSNATGRRVGSLLKNGTAVAGMEVAASSAGTVQLIISQIIDLVPTDYVEGRLFQTSGVSLDTQGPGSVNYMQLQYLGA